MSISPAVALPRRRTPVYAASLGAALVLCGIIGMALLAGPLASYPPGRITGAPIEPPSAVHRLGTNDLGQDLLSLLLHGARWSLAVGFVTALISTALSGAVGMLSVAWPRARLPLLALTDALLAIPHLPVIVLIVALLGPAPIHVIGALALLGWPAFARVVRSQVLGVVQREYVDAARAMGASDARLLRTCVLPEIVPVLWTKFILTVRWAILMEATLALMGLGDPTGVSWGIILHTAFTYPLLFTGPVWMWWALPPAMAIAAMTLALAAVGRDFEAWLNPAAPQR